MRHFLQLVYIKEAKQIKKAIESINDVFLLIFFLLILNKYQDC